jgi:hypothetical protein
VDQPVDQPAHRTKEYIYRASNNALVSEDGVLREIGKLSVRESRQSISVAVYLK